MEESRLKEIEGRMEGITPGEWSIDTYSGAEALVRNPEGTIVVDYSSWVGYNDCDQEEIEANVRFFANVPQDVRDLIAEVRTLRAAMPEKKPWKIWGEGYAATGEHGDATYMGTEYAATFDEAVEKLRKHYPQPELFRKHEDGHWTYWACRLFDNETDARKNYG